MLISLVQIEAASQKTPTLFLQGSATSSTVKNEVNAIVIENSPELYAKKIIELLEDKNYYQRISEKAYEDLFLSWDKVVDSAYKIYVDLINKR